MPLTLVPLLLLVLTAAAPAAGSGGDHLASLVAAERAFASTSVETDMRQAFLAFLAEDAILFRPGPVPGRAWTEERPAPPIVLSWEPVAAEVSHAGDLGYTSGPWEVRSRDGSRPPAHGQFFSIWRRQADGAWKVEVDIGTGNPAPEVPAEPWRPGERPAYWMPVAGEEPDAAAGEESLQGRDRELSRAVVDGGREAYAGALAADVRLLRDDRQPALGRAEAVAALAGAGVLSWTPEAVGVAASGDLGYTWGTYEETGKGGGEGTEKGIYLRAWRREPDGVWRLAVDLAMPLPPPPPPPPPPQG